MEGDLTPPLFYAGQEVNIIANSLFKGEPSPIYSYVNCLRNGALCPPFPLRVA